jgi:hypothetical protein
MPDLFQGGFKLGKIRKVKAYSPSPFYYGKYHPFIISSQRLQLKLFNEKVEKFSENNQLSGIFFYPQYCSP